MYKLKSIVAFALTIILLIPSTVLAQSIDGTSPEVITSNLADLNSHFSNDILKTGWIQYKFIVEMSDARGELPNGKDIPLTSIEEKWYYYDEAVGRITEVYEWSTTENGDLLQEGLLYNQHWFNLTFEKANPYPATLEPGIDFTFGFSERFTFAPSDGGTVSQEIISEGDKNILKFTLTYMNGEDLDNENIDSLGYLGIILVEEDTGKPLGREDYKILHDGSQKPTQKVTTLVLENGLNPPIEKFKQMQSAALEISKKLSFVESETIDNAISLSNEKQSGWSQTGVVGGVNVTAQKDLFYRMSHNVWGGAVDTRSTDWSTPLYNVGMHWYSIQEWCNSTCTYSKYSSYPAYYTNSVNFYAGAIDIPIREGCSTHQIRSNGAHYVRHNGYDWVPYPDTSIYLNRP